MRFEFRTEPLDEHEDVLGVFYGGRGEMGQQYVLTNRRLLMGPLDLGIAQAIENYALNAAVPGAGVGDLVKSVLDAYGPMAAKTIWLRHVVDVQPTNDAGWFHAPGIRVVTDTEQRLDLGIVATATTMSRDSKNNAARDRLVQLLRDAVKSAKEAPAGR